MWTDLLRKKKIEQHFNENSIQQKVWSSNLNARLDLWTLYFN